MKRLATAAIVSALTLASLWAPGTASSRDEPPAAGGRTQDKATAKKAALTGLYPRSPEDSAGAIRVAPGFRAGLFAADPHLASPVAMTFDADGDVYVAEMLDYPIIHTPGMFGPFPEGQIRLLRTDDGGRVVKSTVFATAVAAPTSVVPYDGGVLVSAAPDILFFKDTDGDGHADVRKVVLTGFDAVQDLYRVNSLLWGVDGWVYARGVGNTPVHWGDDPNGPALSTEGMDFRFRPREKKFEAVSGLSSCFGLTTDDWGHRFFSNSANHVYQVVLPNRYLVRNPFLTAPPVTAEVSDHGGVARIFRLSEPQAWRVERSEIWEKTGLNAKYFGTIEPRQDYMTAVTGPKVYRESAFPAEYRGNYFVCEAVSNLVHRDVLTRKGPAYTASRASGEQDREFLASRDNWCSPVYIEAGPDGALYVVDMYRQIIEHAGADGGRDVPNVPLEVLNRYGLRAGSTMGRIYRVSAEGQGRGVKPRLSADSARELAEALDRPDAWWRTTAQRLILERDDKVDVEAIRRVARASKYPAARVQALWTLRELGHTDVRDILPALKHDEPGVRENALVLAEAMVRDNPPLVEAVLAMADDPDPGVRFQLAFTLGETHAPGRFEALAALARRDADNPYGRAAILSSVGDDPLAFFDALTKGDAEDEGVARLLADLTQTVGASLDRKAMTGFLGRLDRRPGLPGRAGALKALNAGIRRRGVKSFEVPEARESMTRLPADPDPAVAGAAAELAVVVKAPSPEERKVATEAAIQEALDDSAPVAGRERAVRSLGSGEWDAVAPAFAELLHPRQPEPVQRAALDALDEQGGPGVVAAVVAAWPGMTPSVRGRALEVALGRKERLLPFLDALAANAVAPEALDAAQRGRLLGSPDGKVARRAKAVLGEAGRKVDPGPFDKVKGALDLRGDARRGEVLFKKTCITCHKVGRAGAEVGPNLVSVKDHTREQTLKDIVYPSLSVQPQYVQYLAETAAGQIYSGVIVSANSASLTIRRPGAPDVTLLRRDLESVGNTEVSLMPENLVKDLGLQEVADLLEFVKRAE